VIEMNLMIDAGVSRFLCVWAVIHRDTFLQLYHRVSPALSPLLSSSLPQDDRESEKLNVNLLLKRFASSANPSFFQSELLRLTTLLSTEKEKEVAIVSASDPSVGKKILRASFAPVIAAHFLSVTTKLQNEVPFCYFEN
jgi:hypothetical protein